MQQSIKKALSSSVVGLTPLLDFYAGVRARRRKIEQAILYCCLGIACAIGVAIWYTDGQLVRDSLMLLEKAGKKERFQSRVKAVNCRLAENRNQPYCQNMLSDVDSNWNSVVLNKDGKTQPFALHERKK